MRAPLGSTSCIIIAAVQCWVAAIAPASCTGSNDWDDVISVSFPSFKAPRYYPMQLRFSSDAGVLDGAIHLTADDIYQPPVQ
ncbi:unnamed protein product [Urochloa humidicola]